MSQEGKPHSILLYTLSGLGVGSMLDFLYRLNANFLALYLFVGSFGLLYVLNYNHKHSLRLVWTAGLCALVFVFPVLLDRRDLWYETIHTRASLYGALPLSLFIINCFLYAFHTENTLKFQYKSLFAATWNTFPLLIAAGMIALGSYCLISLGCRLLDFLYQSDLQKNLYPGDRHVFFIASITLFFSGIGIVKKSIRLIYRMRIILLNIMRYVYPAIAMLTIVFCILYMSREAFREPYSIYKNDAILALCIIGIIIFNAVWQDGQVGYSPRKSLLLLGHTYQIALFILAVTAVHNILVNESQTLNTLMYLLMIAAYAGLYATGVLLQGKAARTCMIRGNIAFAIVILFIVIVINNPFYPSGNLEVIHNPVLPLAEPVGLLFSIPVFFQQYFIS